MKPHPNGQSPMQVLGRSSISPLAEELREDATGIARDNIVALFDDLISRTSHAVRKPQSTADFRMNSLLLDSASLAKKIIEDYWMRIHRSS